MLAIQRNRPVHWLRAIPLALPLFSLVLALACSAGDPAKEQLEALANKAEEEFTKRGEVLFIDTGFAVYCRLNSGFDEGVFKALGFTPSGDAKKSFEFCYNVSSDRKKVALAVTPAKGGATACLVLDASRGTVTRGETRRVSQCLP
ncbi:MAG TPA: hypothetical protein VJ256_05095 [Dehalococcoidia bacterium]|nr:hypothetical protein [Dehalococcoidia bacterium]HLB29646.1 hypothetical protein [Dehalococcoidia bacterium]